MTTTSLGRFLQRLGRSTRRARERGEADLGASALEWAIIAAIVVVGASVIGSVVFNLVQQKGAVLQECAGTAVTAACSF